MSVKNIAHYQGKRFIKKTASLTTSLRCYLHGDVMMTCALSPLYSN
jgi:hypothetical protein